MNISRDKKEQMVQELQAYCELELDIELGSFQAEFLFDFMVKQLAGSTYNQALKDVEALIYDRMERLNEDVSALAKPE